ncbi:MAG: zinc dependent phospholipase C family protein [Candidatus Lokiarchaeia archaeon]
MKWKSHITIAKAISASMGFTKDLEKAFSQGSIDPDKRPDWVVSVLEVAREPHHKPSLGVVMKHIWKARLSYLDGDNIRALKSLGKALHYVQDKCVSKGFLSLSHNSREADLLRQMVSEDSIKMGFNMAVCSPHYIKDTIRRVKPSGDLSEIMRQACLYSAAIAKAVLGNKNPSSKLLEDFGTANKNYRKRTIPVSIGVIMVILLASLVAFFSWRLELGHLAILVASVISAGYITQRLDLKYHYLKEEAKWFRIR